jgi:hypothetical protein
MKSTSFNIRRARRVISSRFPIGVLTIYRIPLLMDLLKLIISLIYQILLNFPLMCALAAMATAQIVKIFYEAAKLAGRLSELQWRFEIEETDAYFLYGSGNKKTTV